MSILFWLTPFIFMFFIMVFKLKLRDHYLFYFFTLAYSALFFIIPAIKYGEVNFRGINLASSSLPSIYDTEIIFNIYLFQTFFYILTFSGYLIIKDKGKVNRLYEISENEKYNINKLMLYCTCLSLIGSVGVVISSGMSLSQLLNSGRFNFWETRSVVSSLIFNYLQTLLAIPAFLYMSIKPKKSLKLFMLFTLIVLFYIEMIIFGTRMSLIFVGTAFLLGVLNYYRSNNLEIKKVRLFGITVLLLHLFVMWQHIRYNMRDYNSVSDWISGLSSVKDAYTLSINQGDLSYFFEAGATAIHYIPLLHDYLYGASYLRVLLFFIPSSIFPYKPEETQRVFASIINPNQYNIGATFPPSVIGDSYINFGVYGVLVGLFVGIFLKISQNILHRPHSINKIIIGSSVIGFLILFLRGTFNGMYNMIFIWIFIYIFSILFAKKSNDKKRLS